MCELNSHQGRVALTLPLMPTKAYKIITILRRKYLDPANGGKQLRIGCKTP